MKGVPLRVEIGMRDIDDNIITVEILCFQFVTKLQIRAIE